MASSLPPARDSRRMRAVQAHTPDGTCCEHIKCLAMKLAEEADELEVRAMLDSLTKVWNRGAILEHAARELDLNTNMGTATGLLMLDIDHFKKVNDNFGHQAGDEVLRQVASRILDGVRATDSVGRYGGEEFVVVLPNCTMSDVFVVAERVRTRIFEEPIDVDCSHVSVSVSIGCTISVAGSHYVDMLVKAADQAMYKAKHLGRNRTETRTLSPSFLSMKAVRR